MKQVNNYLPYYLGFSYCLGIGPMKFVNLKKNFGSVKKAYLANLKELEKILGYKLAEKFVEFRLKFDPHRELEQLKKDEINVFTVDDERYPERLKNISDPPICLYVKGIIPKSKIYFAIVGTRKPTVYGIQITKKFSRELSEAGFIIVSGMALGVDTLAHQEAIDSGGKTIAVLGCGVNVIYPPSNWKLYQDIIKTGGAVISEFPPNQFVLKGLFISRNRIISGLSRGVLIAEGNEFSGALITAKFAGIQGKDVFAIPSPINSEMAPAPNLLIKQGAKMVTSTQDILDEFGMTITPRKKEDIRERLNDIEKLIFDILVKKPETIDDLAIDLHLTASQMLNIISMMEINGVIEKNIEKKYQIRI
jgi:DNA processing protein